MRVLFVTFPWKTHFFNLVSLGWALQTTGHEVRVASEPDVLDTITGAGLTAVKIGSDEPIGDRVRRAWTDGTIPPPEMAPPPGEPARLFDLSPDRERLTWPELLRLYDTLVVARAKVLNDSMIEDLVGYCREWRPDLVVWNALTFAGPIAAAASGAAHARVLYIMDIYSRIREDYLHRMAEQPPAERVDGLREWFTAWLDKYGCEFSEDMLSGQATIDHLFPESFRMDFDLPHLAMRLVPYNGPAVIPQWLSDKPAAPRVLMTFGVSTRDWPELQVLTIGQVQEIFDALADLPIELVATLPPAARDRLDRIPDNTRVVPFVPLHAILPSCAAVINHGGTGSFSTSLLHGVPQLVISTALDAPYKAAKLEETRAGVAIRSDLVSGARVRESLVRLLEDPSFRLGAQRLRQEMLARPTPSEVVPELEKLAARSRS